MRQSLQIRLALLISASVLLFACPANLCGNGKVDKGEACDDGNKTANDGCESTCVATAVECGNGLKQGDEQCDDGNIDSGDGCESNCTLSSNAGTTACANKDKPAPTSGTCTITAGDKGMLISGVVLGAETAYLGGQVLVNEAGIITCTACDCSSEAGAATATKIDCPQAVISPGLINAHDHISYQGNPAIPSDERYEHRHDWRVANDGHTKVNNGGNATNAQIRWAELRNIMAGTTTVVGATYSAVGNVGLMRNLDTSAAGQLGLAGGTVVSDTFPLGDTSGTELTSGCGYSKVPGASIVPADSAYLPHVAEGIEASAQNEFSCLSAADGVGILGPRTGLVHGIGLKASDISLIAQTGTSLIWSPRSNVSLYGDTAAISLYKTLGVNIALGTDWTISGSMNLLRELQCADSLNTNKFGRALTDQQLWQTVTANGADATATGGKIGRLAKDHFADIAIFKRNTTAGASVYRSVIDATPKEVALTIRGGKVLYGDAALVASFDATSMCESLDVCGDSKSVCVKDELTPITTGTNATNTLALLQAANANTYPLFFCGAVMNEPSCVPERAMRNVKNNSSVYTLASTAAGDTDGDGIANGDDNCPNIFNPARPMDNGAQANLDGDALGDVCDPCPLDKDKTTCTVFDSSDRDSDGKKNAEDNCPTLANADQADADSDGKGDVCDACPMASNPGAQACLATIYAIKTPGSPLVGQRLSLNNALVTGVATSGFFLQVAETEPGYPGVNFSGIYAYAPMSGVLQGDRISIDVTTPSNFHGQVQLGGITAVSADGGTRVLSSANPAPVATVVDPLAVASNDGGLAYALEGVLVEVKDVTVIDIAPAVGEADTTPTNEFVVTGGLRINDLMYLPTPFPSVGMQYKSIKGILEFRNGNYKIEPRNAADYEAGPAIVVALEPANGFVREGSTVTIPTPMQVRLSNAETADVAVTVTSSDGALTIGDGGLVIVPAGQVTALVPVLGVTAQATASTVTATKGASMKTAALRVLGASEQAKLISLTPAMATVSPGGKAMMTVTFDLPAPADSAITLTVTPNTVGTAPATVTVLKDAVTASFEFTAANMVGAGTVSATLGADTVSSTVTVAIVSSSHMVISELAVKGPGGAGDEFIELYNPTNQAIDISEWVLQYKSATGNVDTGWQNKAIVPASVSLQAHQYYLIASKSYVGTVAADLVGTADIGLAAASGHVRLLDPQGNVVDKVGYGTTNPKAEPNAPEGAAIMAPVTFTNDQSIERKATAGSTAESMGPGGVDATRGNGVDSDNNGADFVIRTVRDPQNLGSGLTEP